MTRNQYLILAGLVVLVCMVFSCLGISAFALLTTPNAERVANIPPPRPSDTAIPALTSAPTRIPSATPRPTELPTLTQVPTLTKTPSLFTTDEKQYMADAADILEPYFESVTEIGTLLTRASKSIALIRNEDWRISMAFDMAIVKVQGEAYRKLVPPTRFSSLHSDVMNATKRMDKALDLIASGIDNLDVSKINQANQEITAANKLIESATAKGMSMLTPAASSAKPGTSTATRTRTPTPSKIIVGPTSAPNTGVRVGAICKDGTRSTATGSGACSGHGGVSTWLYR